MLPTPVFRPFSPTCIVQCLWAMIKLGGKQSFVEHCSVQEVQTPCLRPDSPQAKPRGIVMEAVRFLCLQGFHPEFQERHVVQYNSCLGRALSLGLPYIAQTRFSLLEDEPGLGAVRWISLGKQSTLCACAPLTVGSCQNRVQAIAWSKNVSSRATQEIYAG